ncbi:MAG: glycosyltransferase family 39 protein [Pirellulaceae bacterium]
MITARTRLNSSVVLLLCVQFTMLALIAWRTGPGWDEWAHLPSGLYTLQYGDFHPYRVNPPLARLIAAVPVALVGGGIDEIPISHATGHRSEWSLMVAYVHQEGVDIFKWMSVARMALIPIAMFGTWLMWRIGFHFGGSVAGLIAATLWVFSPTILTFGATIAPDVSAAVFGLWVSWCFYGWLHTRNAAASIWLSISFSAAMLSKSTWIILPPIFLCLFLAHCWTGTLRFPVRDYLRRLGLVAVVSFVLIHAGYDFKGMLKPIGEFDFISHTLSGNDNDPENGTPVVGNRFRDSFVHWLPAPLPAEYIRGIDVQKRDFEMKFRSYLMGDWANEGWWYYYAVAWLVKEPLSLWLLILLGWSVLLSKERVCTRSTTRRRGMWTVITPGIVVFCFVSSQTGFNHHLRYVLPAFPVVFLVAAYPFRHLPKQFQWASLGLLFWFAVASVWMLPRSYAFFSIGVGGSKSGHRFLNSSNLDWGQDLPTISNWIEKNTDKRPVYLLHPVPQLDYRRLGLDARDGHGLIGENGSLASGWWVISTEQCLREPADWFLKQTPTERISVSTTVYHVIDGVIVSGDALEK